MSTEFIDKYEIISTLGRGSMGVVYKGQDPEIGRLVAIKTLKSVFLGDDPAGNEALQRFRQEARSAGRLHHPNIVTIFEAGRTQAGSPFIVMEYIEGVSLEKMIADQGAIDPLAILHHLSQIASALDYAHQQDVIHRDIKPSNVIIDSSHKPHLLDFGVAKLSDTSLTPAGTVVGTPCYMSPEQIRGARLDGRTDLFSLAVVAYESFTGVRPFPGSDFTTVVSNIIHKDPLSFAEVNCCLPAELELVLRRGLARDRDERFHSALEFIDAAAGVFSVVVDGTGVAGGYRADMSIDDVAQEQFSEVLATSASRAVEAEDVDKEDVISEETIDKTAPFEAMSIADDEEDEVGPDDATPYAGIEALTEESLQGFYQAAQREEHLSEEEPSNDGLPEEEISVPPKSERKSAVVSIVMVFVLCGLVWTLWKWFRPGVSMDGFSETSEELAIVGTEGPTELSLMAEAEESPQQTQEPEQQKNRVLSGLSSEAEFSTLAKEELLSIIVPSTNTKTLRLAIAEAMKRSSVDYNKALVQLSRHPSYIIKVDVIKALSEPPHVSEYDSFKAVSELLGDREYLVRGHAAKVILNFPYDGARDVLRERLELEENEVVKRVLEKALEAGSN